MPRDPETVLGTVPGHGTVQAGDLSFVDGGTITMAAPATPIADRVALAQLADRSDAAQEGAGAVLDRIADDDDDPGLDALADDIVELVGADAIIAGPGLDVSIDDDYLGALTVRLDADAPNGDDLMPAVVQIHDDGRLEVLPAFWDADTGQIVASADEFSISLPFWVNPIVVIGGIIDGIADFITGRTDPPACGLPPPRWARIDPPGSTVHTCFQRNIEGTTGAQRAELYLKSNRGSSLVVTRPTGTAYTWVQGQPDWAQPIIANLTGADRDANIVLPAGQSLSFGFDQPPDVDREIFVEVYTTPQTIILDGIMLLLGGAFDDLLGPALAVNSCVLQVVGVDVVGGDLSF
ncbi:MAG: hypothetical protein AAGA90_07240, partial [Actinomycetota bacterium]